MKREGKRRVRASTLRVLSALGVAALVCLGLALHTGTGTPSSFGIADIAALCPLGGVEAAIASRTVVPPLLIGLAMVIVLTLLLGRAFCAWGCPVPLLRRVFRGKKASKRDASSRDSGPLDVPASERGVCTIRATGCWAGPSSRRLRSGSRCSALCARSV